MYSFTDERFCRSKQCRLWSNASSGSVPFAKLRILEPIVDKEILMAANNGRFINTSFTQTN